MNRRCIAMAGLLVVLGWAMADEARESPSAIRARYRKLAIEPLRIVEPVKIAQAYYWKDGGSIGIELTDAEGTKHAFSLDGGGLPTKGHPRGERPHDLVIGVIHPTREGGKRVAFRGREESALYGVLLRWADAHPQRDAFFDTRIRLDARLDDVRGFLLTLDARFVGH